MFKVKNARKLLVALFTVVIMVFTLFSVSACTNDDIEQIQPNDDAVLGYDTVELDTTNYDDYLTISIELSNSNIEYIGQNALGLGRYVLSCTANLRISKTGNFQFEQATILCGIIVQGWHNGMISANVKLDYDGDGQYSFNLSKESLSNNFDLTSKDCSVGVYAAKGTVRIYQ